MVERSSTTSASTTLTRGLLWLFSWPGVLVLITLIVALYTLGPAPIETIFDGLDYWQWSREAWASGTPEMTEWWHTRWFIQLRSVLSLSLFGTGAIGYYAGPLLSTLIVLSIFAYLIYRFFGAPFVAIFLVLYLVEPELWRQSFQVLPSSFALLSLALFALAYYAYLRTRSLWVFGLLVVICFTLYGTKVPYLFPLVGFGFALLLRREYKLIAILVGGGIVLYALETVYFNLITGGAFPDLGRLQYMITNRSLQTTSDAINLTIWDVLARWNRGVNLTSSYSYIAFFLLGPLFLYLSAKGPTPKMHLAQNTNPIMQDFMFVFVWMGLAFAFFTTFFITSFDPLNVAQPFRSRYLVFLLPIAYITVIWFLDLIQRNWHNRRWRVRLTLRAIGIGLVGIYVGIFSLFFILGDRVDVQIGVPPHYRPIPYNIWTADAYYAQLVTDILAEECIAVQSFRELRVVMALLPAEQLERLQDSDVLPLQDRIINYDAIPGKERVNNLPYRIYYPRRCERVLWYGTLSAREVLPASVAEDLNALRLAN